MYVWDLCSADVATPLEWQHPQIVTTMKNIVTLWENTDSSENSGNFPIHLSTGTSRIKIVGKKAQGTATLSLADNSDVQVEAVSYSK